jgi:hypothetical protein
MPSHVFFDVPSMKFILGGQVGSNKELLPSLAASKAIARVRKMLLLARIIFSE